MFAFKLILLLFLGAPLVLVLSGVLLARRERKVLLSAVRALGCPSCRAGLSELSLKAADDLWQRHFATLSEQNPGVKFRVVRRLAAVCQACGARLHFDPKTRTLEPMTIVLAFETDAGDDRTSS